MPRFNNIWDVTPDTAHPRAKQLLHKSIVWNYGDEDSPLGNDTGADTFAAYLNFRAAHPAGRIQDFVSDHLSLLDVSDSDWDDLDEEHVRQLLDRDNGFSMLTRDDFIIGLAFAQLLLEGTVDADIRKRAILALRRQSTDVVLSFRSCIGHDTRKKQLLEFQRILELL